MLHHLGYLWAATAIVWGGTLAYVVYLVQRQSKLQKELAQIEAILKERR